MAEKKLRRNTKQRQVVLDELRKLNNHPTAAELHELARRRLPRLSLATVYRNLELLMQLGVVRKLEMGGSEARFDGDLDSHYHVHCVRCGRVEDVHGVPTDFARDKFTSPSGYSIIGHQVEFAGICPACEALPSEKADEQTAREVT
ncbi:MAG: transcriptional repressor [Planctomycetota bacterium]